MKNSIKILMTAFAASLLLAGCQSKIDQEPLTQANIVIAPEVFGSFADLQTRAVDLAQTDDPTYANYYYNGFLGEPPKIKLPIGATVWLTYRKAKSGVTNPGPPVDADWDAPDLQAYVVADAAGYNALYPIGSHEVLDANNVVYLEVDENYTITNPLYLKDGKYQFRMVSPANEIRKDNLSMQVDNGMQVYANDERYVQTASKVIEIASNGSGVQNIVLNPMINQTARIKLTMKPGANVTTMEMMSQGIEISGLQNPETENGKLAFKWSSLALKDTLVMKRADKKSNTFIKEVTEDEHGYLIGSACILPTNSMSTASVILINLAVNGVPTQYVITLSQIKFFHGHSYNLEVEVGLDGNINVLNWANQSWTGEVSLN